MTRRREIAHQGAIFAIVVALSVVHTWPLARDWRTALLGGHLEDPWMQLWHLDWVRRSLLSGTNPFFSQALHHPLGAELYWHTLSPAKTLPAALLLPWLGPVGSYNLAIFGTFVLTGTSMFWLCADRLHPLALPRLARDGCALVGACVFDFSRYHLAHSVAHLNLSALEGMPLFLLGFFRALETGKRRWVVLAAASAGYVAACDFYYVYYLALFASAWVIASASAEGRLFSRATLARTVVRRAAVLGGASAAVVLVVVLPLLLHLHPAPIEYHHGDSEYPADLLSPWLPDHLSAWNRSLPTFVRITANRMQREILNDAEGGCFVGIVAPLLAYAALRRNTIHGKRHAVLLACFAALSLGVYLGIGGLYVHAPFVAVALLIALGWRALGQTDAARDLRVGALLLLALVPFLDLTAYREPVHVRIPMPFLIFKSVVPLFGRGGMPVRFLLLSQLSLAVLAAWGAARLVRRRHGMALLVAALVLVNLETRNVAMPMTPVRVDPAIFDSIRNDAEPGVAVYTDHVLGQWEETLHHKPVSFARQSRLPARELPLYESPLRRFLADPKHMADPVDEATLTELRQLLRDGQYKYFVAHTATTRFGDYPQELALAREGLVARLGGALVHGDEERQIYRFW